MSRERPLNPGTFRQGIAALAAQDADLAGLTARWGNPPFWTHTPGYPGLVLAILAQQVSLESAQAAFAKLELAIDSVAPREVLALNDQQLRAMGFSRQKASYVRGLARGIVSGKIDLDALASMDDGDARTYLVACRGIGLWTADTYLLFSLRRPDAWPSGDLALAKAIQELRGWATTPSYTEADKIAEHWRPWRAVAARILWHHYLSERGRTAAA